ncbi:MAG: ribonucleoside triphosphate reductase [Candidatus Pacebacteria bacterium]|nr:ribonucleoside triphosphate reductase [Candidatus Paceibacterota bacterium]
MNAKKIKIKQIRKRNGRIVKFEKSKLINAIYKAFSATEEGSKRNAMDLAKKVECEMSKRFTVRNGGGKLKVEIPSVEEIQDIVESFLIRENYIETAKSYIIYREQHRLMRESQDILKKSTDLVDDYLKEIDWRVKENSNMAYSLQGLNNHISSIITAKYWVEKIYPPEIREAHDGGDFHIHDLGLLAVYCCGWDLKELITHGFGGVTGKIESKPPKHFRSALGQVVNFFYTLQGEAAGAEAFSSFDTLLAPFIKYDQLTYRDVKQAIQEFVFNMNVPTRVGFQTPFTNITMDLVVPSTLANEYVIIGGVPQKEQYKDFTNEISLLNKAFAEVMLEGDASGRVFTFPIPTYNITKDFNWDDPNLEPIWEMTAKYGIPYFANYIGSDMKPEDARSMCCRLRLDNRELYKRGGGLFGAHPLTGSIGVVTINLPRIGYLSKTKKEFYNLLGRNMDLAKESLEIKRKNLESFTEKGLYPYSKYFLSNIKLQRGEYWGNHFSTIGIIGMNEALQNFAGTKTSIATKKGNKFAEEVLEFMRDKMVKYQEETGGLFNLEATPGEGTSYGLARKDVKKYPDIITATMEA